MNNHVKITRIKSGITQEQLAKKVGVTRQTIGLIENGKYNPSLQLCIAIAKELNKTLDDLFWEVDEKMKSWLSFFLPKNEFKEKMILYFLSEGAIILSSFLFVLMIGDTYFLVEVDSYLIILFATFLFYVVGRYIASCIEYASISTDRSSTDFVLHRNLYLLNIYNFKSFQIKQTV